MEEIDSGHLHSIGWEGGILQIRFRDGKLYQYFDVPNGVYQELRGASSASQYFRDNIKGHFEYAKVNEDPDSG